MIKKLNDVVDVFLFDYFREFFIRSDGKHNYMGFGIHGNYATPIDWLHDTRYVKGGLLRNEFSVSWDGVSSDFDRASNYWGALFSTYGEI